MHNVYGIPILTCYLVAVLPCSLANLHYVLYFHAPSVLPTTTIHVLPCWDVDCGTRLLITSQETAPATTINTTDPTPADTALQLNQNQFRQSSVRVGSSNTSSSEQLGGHSLAHLTHPHTTSSTKTTVEERSRHRQDSIQPVPSIGGTSKSCELIVLPYPATIATQQRTPGQKSSNEAGVRVELRRNRSLNEQQSVDVVPHSANRGAHCPAIRAATTTTQVVPLKRHPNTRTSSVDGHTYYYSAKVDVGTGTAAPVPSITVDVGSDKQAKRTSLTRVGVGGDCLSAATTTAEAPGKPPGDATNNTRSGRDLKVFKHKPIISTSFDCAGQYDDPYFHRYDDENERLDDNEEKRLFPVRLDGKAKLQSNSDIILRNHSYKSCVKRKSNHSTGNLDDLFLSLRASGDHQPQFAYYYLDDPATTATTSSSSQHSPSPSQHPLVNSLTTAAGVVVVGNRQAPATSREAKHSLSKSLNCLRKRSAKLKFHLKPLKIAQITTDSDSISISNCQVPITLAQYTGNNAASSSSLSLSPGGGGALAVCNAPQQHSPSYVPSGAASSGSSPNRYSSTTLPKLGGSLNRPRLNSSDSHKVQSKHKSKPVHHHSHQDPICAGYATPSGSSGTAFELQQTSGTNKSPNLSGGVVPRPTPSHHHAHRHSVATAAIAGAQPPKHLSTQSLTTACWYPSSSQQQCPSGGGQTSHNTTNTASSDSGGGHNNNNSSSSYNNNNNNQNSANGASSSSYSSAAPTQAQPHPRPSLAGGPGQNNLSNNNNNYPSGSPRSDTRSNNSFSQNIYSASATNSGNNQSASAGGVVGGAKPSRVNSDRHVYDFNRQLSAPIENRSSSSSVNNIIPSHQQHHPNNQHTASHSGLGGHSNGTGAANYYPHLVGSSYTNSLTRNKKHRSLKLTGR